MKPKINETKMKLIVKRIFEYGDTWQDVENMFNTNQNRLKEEMKEFLSQKPNQEERIKMLFLRAESNATLKKKKREQEER